MEEETESISNSQEKYEKEIINFNKNNLINIFIKKYLFYKKNNSKFKNKDVNHIDVNQRYNVDFILYIFHKNMEKSFY